MKKISSIGIGETNFNMNYHRTSVLSAWPRVAALLATLVLLPIAHSHAAPPATAATPTATSAATPAIATPKQESCVAFQGLVKATYNFDVLKLSNKEKWALVKRLDTFWTAVKAHQREYLPCLRKALEEPILEPKANAFFRFDGGNLLVELEPSPASKELQVQIYTATDLEIVGEQRWITVLSVRGTEGFDVSQAATRWLSDPDAGYTLPEHGDFAVGSFEGAVFLFGSMNEEQATPALLKIINQPKHPQREAALEILTSQATLEAWRALQKLTPASFSKEAGDNLQGLLEKPELIEPRGEPPQISRDQFIKAFEAFIKGDTKPFFALVDKTEDGERDAIAVLKPADLPLVRQVRRRFMLGGNQHSISYYQDFTNILWTLVWKQEPNV
jgi:hypothetical protein